MHPSPATAQRAFYALLLALCVLFGLDVTKSAAQTKFPGYVSGAQIANLSSTTTTTIVLTAYRTDGNQVGEQVTDQIPALSSKTYFFVSAPDREFIGSMVVGSNQPIGAIVNVLATLKSSYPAASSYTMANFNEELVVQLPLIVNGAADSASAAKIVADTPSLTAAGTAADTAAGTTMLLPLLMKDNGGYTTWYSIQNASAAPATANVTYSDGTLAGPFTIPPRAAQYVYQSQESHNAAVFAATITSDQPLVAAVIQESTKVMLSYSGFSGGSTTPVFPLVNANNSGYVTGLQIQNVGNAASIVTVTYTPATTGAPCTETQTIQAGSSNTFALNAFNPGKPMDASSNCAKTHFVGSARVTGNSTNQPLVGIGNQLLPGANGGTYSAFAPSDAGQNVILPLIMDGNSGYFTGFNVQNVGNTATDVICEFQNNPLTIAATLQPGQALNDLQQGRLGDRYVGAAICSGSAADAQLVAVVNQLKPSTQDNFLVYEGIRQP